MYEKSPKEIFFDFRERVETQFSYLVSDYGYELMTSGEYGKQLDWMLVYKSTETTVRIVFNGFSIATFNPNARYEKLLEAGASFKPDWDAPATTHFDIFSIFTLVGYCHDYPVATTVDELYWNTIKKNSLNRSEKRFLKIPILARLIRKQEKLDRSHRIALEVPILAQLVQMYAEPLLKGDWTNELMDRLHKYYWDVIQLNNWYGVKHWNDKSIWKWRTKHPIIHENRLPLNR